VGPHPDLKQGFDLSALFAWRVRSQSAPGGTPQQRQIYEQLNILRQLIGGVPPRC